jgi:hypothetical protein
LLVAACSIDSQAADGQSCKLDSDCKSDHCAYGTCVGSACSCSGACSQSGSPSGDCPSSWLCVYEPPDAVTGFFGASGGNYCEPGCSSCPTHWSCAAGATHSTYDTSWSEPQVTISGPTTGETGQPLTFVAHATSPDGASIATYAWTFDSFHGTSPSSSDTTTYTFASPGAYTVTAYVVDGSGQTGQATLPVTICSPHGRDLRRPRGLLHLG